MSAPCTRCHRHSAELDANGRCKDTYHCGRCVISDLQNRRPYQTPGKVTLHPSERDTIDREPAYSAATKASDAIRDEIFDADEIHTGKGRLPPRKKP